MSRKFRVEVGVQALDPMISILERDRADDEVVSYALDTLSNICSPEEFEEEVASPKKPSGKQQDHQYGCVGEQFTEIYLKKAKNVQLALDTLEEYDFKVRRPAIKLLTNLLINKPRDMQEIILGSHLGVSRLMDVLVDSREVMRNDALLLLIQLTKGHANLQKIVAFENAFDKLVDIIETEGHSDGGIVVEDCLRLMLNLLRNNASNQTFFREGSYIQRISPFFELNLDEEELEVGWAAQKVSNMLYMLSVVRTLIAPSNPTQVTLSCQTTIESCGLLKRFSGILMAAGIPADILTETINTLSECIRGNAKNQDEFSKVLAPSNPPRSALILLLMSMVNEKQPFELRCAILYCLQCYVHKHPRGQQEIMQTLLPSHKDTKPKLPGEEDDVTAGQLLCGGLFSSDEMSNWFSAVALAHGMMDQEGLKVELLRVQLTTTNSNGASVPVTLLQQCMTVLQQSNNVQTRLGLLMLISTWASQCPTCVTSILSIQTVIPFLTGQIGSNEHDEMERLSQGLCSYLLGLCIVANDNSVAGASQEELMQLIEKRIGFEVFMDKLGEVTKHEAYNRALKHPQIKSNELVFDNKFCQQFKQTEHVVINHLSANHTNDTSSQQQPDPAVLKQYKDLIREQDTRINQISQANIYLQQELASAKQQIEDMASTVQTLQDQNSLLKAQSGAAPPVTINGPVNSEHLNKALSDSEEAKNRLERELKVRDDIINELEMRLAVVPEDGGKIVEVETMQKQLNAMQVILANKDEEIERLKATTMTTVNGSGTPLKNALLPNGGEGDNHHKEALEALQAEQEDLLLMLSDQDGKLRDYKRKLKELGQPVDQDEDDFDDDDSEN